MYARPPIDGATILITGASSGIGWEMARQLAPRAKALVLVARRADRLESLREALATDHPALTISVQACDLSDVEAIGPLLDAIHAEVGTIDVLINNAGLGDIELFDTSPEEKLVQMVRINTLAPVVLTKRLLPAMIAAGRGGVLNISSGFGLTFMPVAATYIGTKHFISAWTESLRLEMVGTGVAISQTCFGPVATEFEAKAGNPVGMSVPWPLELGVEKATRQSLRAFERGRALKIPGLWISVLIGLGRLSPAWLLRLTYLPLTPLLRRKRARQLTAAD